MIFVSGDPSLDQIRQNKGVEQMAGFVKKPFEVQEINELVSCILTHARRTSHVILVTRPVSQPPQTTPEATRFALQSASIETITIVVSFVEVLTKDNGRCVPPASGHKATENPPCVAGPRSISCLHAE